MPRTIRPAAGALTVKLHEPLTNLEAAILAEHSGDAEDKAAERLEAIITELSRRLEGRETWHTLTRSDLMSVLHASAFARLLLYHQRDTIAQLKQRCYEQTLDSLIASRGIGGYVG